MISLQIKVGEITGVIYLLESSFDGVEYLEKALDPDNIPEDYKLIEKYTISLKGLYQDVYKMINGQDMLAIIRSKSKVNLKISDEFYNVSVLLLYSSVGYMQNEINNYYLNGWDLKPECWNSYIQSCMVLLKIISEKHQFEL